MNVLANLTESQFFYIGMPLMHCAGLFMVYYMTRTAVISQFIDNRFKRKTKITKAIFYILLIPACGLISLIIARNFNIVFVRWIISTYLAAFVGVNDGCSRYDTMTEKEMEDFKNAGKTSA